MTRKPERHRNLEPMPPEGNERARNAAGTAVGIVLVVVSVALLIGGLVLLAGLVTFVVGINNFGSNK